MPSLNADVQLEISAAESEVDALAAYMQASLADATGSFDAAFSSAVADLTAQIVALTETLQAGITASAGTLETELSSGIQAATDQLTTFDQGLAQAASDAGTIGDELSSGVSGASDSLSGLSDSISQVGDSAGSADGQVTDLSDHTSALAGGAALATGSVGGLKSVAGDLAPGALAAAGGVLALSGGIVELFHAGLDATSAEERFNAALGDQAKLVNEIHIGDLNTTLEKLAAEFGTTTAAMQNSVATTFQFAQNAGAGVEASTRFSQELFVLAARAVALKPSLGDVSDVATRMEVGLGRARSAAQQFGISVSQAEINTRALSDTGKESASDLTAYEKAVAGAEIAIDRYGSTLNDKLAEGSQNAAIQQRALTAEVKNAIEEFGKPLVAPMLDAIRAGIPDLVQFGSALAEIAQVVLPPLAEVLRLIGPAIQPAIIGFAAFYTASVILPAVMEAITGATLLLGLQFGLTGEAALAGAAEVEAATTAIEASAGPVGLLVAGLGFAAGALGLFGDSSHKAADEAKGFADELAKTGDAVLLAKFDKQVDGMDAVGLGADRAKVSLVAFRQISEDNVGVGQRLLQAMESQGIGAGKYKDILDSVVQKQAEQKSAQEQTKLTLDALSTSQTTANSTLQNATTSQVAAAQAANDYYDALTKETKALDAAADRITALNDKSFAVTHAQKAAADAVDTYTKSLTDGKSSQLDQNDALATAEENFEKVGAAARDEAEANDTSGNSAHAAAAGSAAQISALQNLAGTLDPSSPLRQFLDAYIVKLQNVPPTVETNIFVTGSAQQQLDEIQRTMSIINGTSISIPSQYGTTSGGYTGLMAGGPAQPNTTYLVGEAGPELFTTGPLGGYVTPNSMILGNSDKAGVGAHSIQVVVQVTASPEMSDARAHEVGSLAGAAAAREVRAIIGSL